MVGGRSVCGYEQRSLIEKFFGGGRKKPRTNWGAFFLMAFMGGVRKRGGEQVRRSRAETAPFSENVPVKT